MRVGAYPLLLALGALDAAGYSVIVPVAPSIAEATGAGPATVGLLVASFPAGMVAGFALAGWLVRRNGARALLAGSLALVALGALGFVLGDSLAVYFPSRLLMGGGSGGIWIGVTFDTLERWPGQEYLCMSRVFAAYSAGGLIGPALAATTSDAPTYSAPICAWLSRSAKCSGSTPSSTPSASTANRIAADAIQKPRVRSASRSVAKSRRAAGSATRSTSGMARTSRPR